MQRARDHHVSFGEGGAGRSSAQAFVATRPMSPSARLLNADTRRRLRRQEFGILLVPQVIAGTERTELSLEGTGRPGEFFGIDVQPHEHVMAGQPAPRDDLRHRISPCSIISRRDNIADPAKFQGAPARPGRRPGGGRVR